MEVSSAACAYYKSKVRFKPFKSFKPNIGRFKVPGSKFNVNLLSLVPVVPNAPIVPVWGSFCGQTFYISTIGQQNRAKEYESNLDALLELVEDDAGHAVFVCVPDDP
jgi:hypothetical protein